MASSQEGSNEFRLPKNIVPEHYDLFVTPNFNNFTFKGRVEITYNKTDEKPTSKVKLHSNDIQIHEGFLDGRKLIDKTYDVKSNTVTLNFESDLPQRGKIVLDYTGNLNDAFVGFYRSSVTLEGAKLFAATTKFEPTDARRFLPCWDEPAVKATFSIALKYKRFVALPSGTKIEYVGLSNTPILEETVDSDEVTVRFKKSPKMSTYLLALICGPFEYIEESDGKRPVRVYTTPGKKELGRFALEVAYKSMQFYENYFGVNYPIDKIDLIAIPDFASGAMENWGLVTFRETALLVDPNNSSTAIKQRVAIVVAHELAHQWFGNLVTMEWWTHLWLNEGFAAFMEHLCGNYIFPEYEMWSQFVSDAFSFALELDSMHNSHPIEVPVNHPSEVKEIFDAISYKKGASVIRMIHNFVGDDAFRSGLKDYLTKFAYQNTVTEDLWDCLERASGKPISRLGSSWTSQKGYPWLSVLSCPMEGNKTKLTITQEKFSSDGKISDDERNIKWEIPLAYMTGLKPSKHSDMLLMSSKTNEIIVENAGDSWIKLNPNSVAIYRTAYSQEMSQKLLPGIKEKTLPTVDRLNLQSDFFALTLAGKHDIVSYLKFLQNFKQEDDYIVWSSIDSSIGRLSTILSHTDYSDSFKAYVRALYEQIYEKIGWEQRAQDKHTDRLLRSKILNRMVSLHHKNSINEARDRFKDHVSKEKLIPGDLRLAVYKVIAQFGTDEEFDSLFDIFRSTDLHEEKNRAASSLGYTMNPQRLERVAQFTFSDEIRDQDRIFVISALSVQNPNFAWNLFKEKKDVIERKYGDSHIFRMIVKTTTEHFAREEDVKDIEKFFSENRYPQANRVISQSLETIKLNAHLLSKESDAIRKFLAT